MKLILLTMITVTSIIQNVDANVPGIEKLNDFSHNKLSKSEQLLKEYMIDPSDVIFLQSGDSTDQIENGDIFSLDNNEELYVAVRDINDRLTYESLAQDFEITPNFKRPCLYNGKVYAHGQIIAVDPGRWLNYRGFPVMLRPGKMLVCRNGVLHEYEVRPRY
jgi:hypothetical protein